MLHQNLRLRLPLILLAVAVCAVLYGRGLMWPGSGLDYDDAVGGQGMKMLAFACTVAWLFVLYRLLRTFGASPDGALALCGLTAASPVVVFWGTHHSLYPGFALLATGALLALLYARPVVAGVLAAIACALHTGGIALLAAGIVTLVARRRLRDAGLFAAGAMLLAGPGIGWKLAHGGLGGNVVTHLAASDKAIVLKANAAGAMEAPGAWVSGSGNLYSACVFGVLLIWALWKRRQLMPDLFVLFFAGALLLRIGPPERYLAVAMPLVLWMLWRGLRSMRAEVLAAAAILLFGVEAVSSFRQTPPEWAGMEKLFDALRHDTPADAVVVSNVNEPVGFYSARKALRGFARDRFQVFYRPDSVIVTPDALNRSLIRLGSAYVALTPDFGRAEAPSYRRAVEALEHGGVLQPVNASGLPAGYRLLSYVPNLGVVPARNR